MCALFGIVGRQFPPFKGKCWVGRVTARALLGAGQARLRVTMRNGCHLWLDPRSRMEAGPFFDGVYEDDESAFFACCSPVSGTAIDVGANIGLLAVPLALHLGVRGYLLAVEPVAANADALVQNVASNDLSDVIHVARCAVGATAGRLLIGRETGTGAGTGNAYPEASSVGIEGLQWTEVAQRTLDDVVNEAALERVDFIKMDVEGAELDVLAGSVSIIETFRPIIYGEFQLTLRPEAAGTFQDVGRLIEPFDYEVFGFTSRLTLVRIPFEAGRGNAVLCPREKVGWMLQRCIEARA